MFEHSSGGRPTFEMLTQSRQGEKYPKATATRTSPVLRPALDSRIATTRGLQRLLAERPRASVGGKKWSCSFVNKGAG
jgi:hypothetical protein